MLRVLILLLCSFTVRAQVVFKTPSGAKYHAYSCRMVKNVSEELTLAEAKSRGLEACKICHPEQAPSKNDSTVHKAKGEASTTHCNGRTKAGTRCRHMTRIANGYCFQHQPKS